MDRGLRLCALLMVMCEPAVGPSPVIRPRLKSPRPVYTQQMNLLCSTKTVSSGTIMSEHGRRPSSCPGPGSVSVSRKGPKPRERAPAEVRLASQHRVRL